MIRYDDELQAEWCRLSEAMTKALDNPKQLYKIRKKMDAFWRKVSRQTGI